MNALAIALAAATAAAPAVTTADFAKAVLDAHNAARAAIPVAPLAWSDKLAGEAAAWAAHLAELGHMQHSAHSARGNEGENLWMGTAGAYTPGEMVQTWVDEKKDFHYGPFGLSGDKPGPQPVVGHYTQVIWRTTTQLGCATAAAGTWTILVCRYAPEGNLVGAMPY